MPKIKTRKSASKRFKITKQGKILRKRTGKDHFNAKETGNKTRKKRNMSIVSKTDKRGIKKMLPYI